MTTANANASQTTPEQLAARANMANFDVSKLGAGKKVELEGDLAFSLVPDKEGFLVGTVIVAKYIATKRVVSDKLTTSKKDDNGDKFRNLHSFEDATGVRFGIWGTGMLDLYLKQSAKENDILSIKYTGRAAEPLQKGQQPPMEFEIIKF
jgi:hypothetical protein